MAGSCRYNCIYVLGFAVAVSCLARSSVGAELELTPQNAAQVAGSWGESFLMKLRHANPDLPQAPRYLFPFSGFLARVSLYMSLKR